MIKIKRLLSYGGACPYQLEAITSDDKWLYIRYRHGVLSYVVADSEKEWMNGDCVEYNFSEKIGKDNDGYAKHDLIYSYLHDKIKFPQDFRLESLPNLDNN